MADNTKQYGVRWVGNLYGMPYPKPVKMLVPTGKNFNVVGDATNLNLNVGDVVTITANGVLDVCGGSEFTAGVSQPIYGVVCGFGESGVWNGTRMVRQNFLQSGVNWGTIRDRAPEVYVIPAEMGVWEVDVNDNTTATTEAAYQLFVGQNCDMVNLPDDTNLLINPRLNISTHANTSTLGWRILEIARQSRLNADYSGLNVKMHVQVNKGTSPLYTNVGI